MSSPALYHDACTPCAGLFPKLSETTENSRVVLPEEVRRLTVCGADHRRCPECGTLYGYVEDHDPGEPMVLATSTWSLVRFSAWRAERVRKGTSRDGWESHQRALLPSGIGGLLFTQKKYVAESLTDLWLDERRFDDIDRELLDGTDPVVATETAADLLHIGTEEHRVWCVREFLPSQRPAAKEYLTSEQGRHARALVRSLGRNLAAEGKSFALDSTFGYRETETWFVAFLALENAVFRGFPVAEAVEGLVPRLHHPMRRVSDSAADMLIHAAKEGAEARARLARAMTNAKGKEPADRPEAIRRVWNALGAP